VYEQLEMISKLFTSGCIKRTATIENFESPYSGHHSKVPWRRELQFCATGSWTNGWKNGWSTGEREAIRKLCRCFEGRSNPMAGGSI